MERIKNEIKQTDIPALTIDKTSDIVHKSKLLTVLYYIDRYNSVQEKFLGITDVSQDCTASTLFE